MRQFVGVLVISLLLLALVNPTAAATLETRKQRIIDFSADCLDSSGGALLHPQAANPTVSTTFAIASVLDTLNAWTDIDQRYPQWDVPVNMTNWIHNLQNTTDTNNNTDYGGFHSFPGEKSASLSATYYAVQTLMFLNQTDVINSTSLVEYISGLQQVNATAYPDTVGGFMDSPNATASIAATFFAIQTLAVYDQLDQINESLASSWAISCQLLTPPDSPGYGGFLNGRNATFTDLQSTFMAIHCLNTLGALSAINQTAATLFILSCYNADPNYSQHQGGFGSTPSETVSTQLATFYAVTTLVLLDAANQLTIADVTAWILSKQTLDGGFADFTSGTGFAPQTHEAVVTLAELNQLNTLNELVGIEPFIFPWLIVGAVMLVIIAVTCLIIARRQEWL